MTQEELDNSIPLNTCKLTHVVDAPDVISAIWKVVYGSKKPYRAESKQANHIRLLLSKLYTCHKSRYDCIGYSRYGVNYRLEDPDNVLQLSYRVTLAIVDVLFASGFIEDWRGCTYADKWSRMRAKESLISLIESIQLPIELPFDDGIRDDSIFIKYKDHGKKRIPLVDDEFTIAWNQQLIAYNRLLARSSLSLSCPTPKGINFDRRIVTRTFNDESLRLGGRFYGGWWLRMESQHRKHILINGEPTVEIDYKGIHLFLAYQMEGFDCFKLFDGDPYVIDDPDLGIEWRDVTKSVILQSLNAKNRNGAAVSINGNMNQRGKNGKRIKKKLRRHPKYTPRQLVDICIEQHPLVNHYFCVDCGKMLQFYDSHIASQVIQHFLNSDIPILCIHDSFICQKLYADELNDVMKSVVETSYGLEPITKWSMVCDQSDVVQ